MTARCHSRTSQGGQAIHHPDTSVPCCHPHTPLKIPLCAGGRSLRANGPHGSGYRSRSRPCACALASGSQEHIGNRSSPMWRARSPCRHACNNSFNRISGRFWLPRQFERRRHMHGCALARLRRGRYVIDLDASDSPARSIAREATIRSSSDEPEPEK